MIRLGNVISSNYIGKSAIFDAPKNGTTYGRRNGAWNAITGGLSGASAFTNLTDVPTDYTDQAGKILAVNEAEDALVFIDPATGGSSNFWSSPTTNRNFDMVEWSSGSVVTVGLTPPDTEFAKWFDIADAPVANTNDIIAVWMQVVVDVQAELDEVPYDRTIVFYDRLSFGVNIDPDNGGQAYEGVRSYIGDGFIAQNSLNIRVKFSDEPADAGRLYANLFFGPTRGTLTFYWNAKLFISAPITPF